jgi:hypothetical protein
VQRFRYQAAGAVILIAATAMTSSTALASSTSTASVIAANAAQTSHQRGNVEVLVPPAVIASSDGLARTLTIGTTNHLDVPVWVAAGQPQTNARIDLVGAQVTRCGRTRLMPGTITTLRCRVVPIAAATATDLVVTVVVDVAATPVGATFHHDVRAHPAS